MLRLLPFRLLLRPRERADDPRPTTSSRKPSRQTHQPRSRRPHRKYWESNSFHSFRGLPAELFNHILEYLQRDDLACLALTCHRMHDLLGSTYWTLKNHSNDENMKFLSRLARDSIGWHVCSRCVRLHANFSTTTFSGEKSGKTCIRNPKLTCMEHTPLQKFDFARLHSIMNDYRVTGSTSLVGDIRTPWRYDETPDKRVPRRGLFLVEGKTVDRALHLRTQQWLYVDTESDLRRCIEEYSYNRWTPKLDTCGHQKPYDPIFTWKSWQRYRNLFQVRHSLDYPLPMELMQNCNECGVAWHMMTFPTTNGGRACVVTRWLRLGVGLVLCPNDELWYIAKGHVPGNEVQRTMYYFPYMTTWHYQPHLSLIQQAYEASEMVSWSQLTKGNRNLLEHDDSIRNLIVPAVAWPEDEGASPPGTMSVGRYLSKK